MKKNEAGEDSAARELLKIARDLHRRGISADHAVGILRKHFDALDSEKEQAQSVDSSKNPSASERLTGK